MNFETYRPLALRTAKLFPTQGRNLAHAALGLITEIGEFASEVKRIVIYGKPLNEDMRLQMLEELGDACWYVPLALHAEGIEHFDYAGTQKALALAHDNLERITYALNEMSGKVSDITLRADQRDCVPHLLAVVALIDIAAGLLGTTGDQVRADNIKKLRLRFPDKYSDAAAEARADKAGVDHRNS